MTASGFQITYICHSGFLVETEECYYLFDYYMGRLPLLCPKKPILVFASHSHRDHYNPEIFTRLKTLGMEDITAVLSKDISEKKYPVGVKVCKVSFHQTYDLPFGATLKTLKSTDAGVAFLLQCREGVLYHAGDLNDWAWAEETEQYNRQMTGSYRHEIDLLKCSLLEGKGVDVAFLPLDPRQEKDYAKGILYFLKKIRVTRVYPMHYWGKSQIIQKFLQEYPEYKGLIQDTEEAGTAENTRSTEGTGPQASNCHTQTKSNTDKRGTRHEI